MSKQRVLQEKMFSAAKWSFMAECSAKLVTPITNMILARILEPDDFGLLSIVTMITSFADMFTDAGAQKYLVQHEFESDTELHEYASVAFWSNLIMTIIMWIVIIIAAVPLTILMNKPGYQWVMIIGSTKMFLTAITTIQRAMYQRSLDYRTMFYVRIMVAMIPIVVTIPLALMGFQYWALIIGILANEFVYAVALTLKSKWKPRRYFSMKKLKNMLSFSIWSLAEQILIWLSDYADVFVLSIILTDYALGMYKQPESTLSAIYGVFTGTISGILFSALSRMNDRHNKESDFWNAVSKIQTMLAMIMFPLSFGIFLYGDLITEILLGSQWSAGAIVIKYMALYQGVHQVMNCLSSTIYRAKGEPKVSAFAQLVYICVLIPASIISISYGFDVFVRVRASMSCVFMVIHYVILKIRYKICYRDIWRNIKFPLFASIIMLVVGWKIKETINGNIFFDIINIAVCICVYFALICCFKTTRTLFIESLKKSFPNFFKYKEKNKGKKL